jgi:hypothetical protein
LKPQSLQRKKERKKRRKRAGVLTQEVEHLPSKHETLSSNPSTPPPTKRNLEINVIFD